jgi:hypothetical protein
MSDQQNTTDASDQPSSSEEQKVVSDQQTMETEKTSKKRDRDEESTDDQPNKIQNVGDEPDEDEEDEPAHFIHWRWLTVDVLKKCVKWSEVKSIPKKCQLVWINFNYDMFRKICPDHPPVNPRQRKLYYTRPFLKASFGYSPHPTANGIANDLRLVFADFYDTESSEYYQRMKEWDEWLIDEIFAHKDVWPLKIKLEPGEVLKRSDVSKKYCGICRTPMDEDGKILDDFPQYTNVKFNTFKGDAKKKPPIPADPYTAFATVWDGNKNLVTEVLTRENAVPTKDEAKEDPELESKRKIIINKNFYTQGIDQLQKIYFASTFGPTLIVDEVLFETEENLKAKKDTKKSCRFA